MIILFYFAVYFSLFNYFYQLLSWKYCKNLTMCVYCRGRIYFYFLKKSKNSDSLVSLMCFHGPAALHQDKGAVWLDDTPRLARCLSAALQ